MSTKTVKVWDLPTRLFHWLLVVGFVTAWLTRGSRYLDIHVFAGYATAGLLLFRLLWGLIGSPHARFADFSYCWREAWCYVKGILVRNPTRYLGHNPAGSWSIYLILGLLATITATGLLTLGGEERHGPLAGWLSFEQGVLLHQIHEVLAWTLLALVPVHLAGVAIESFIYRENLAKSMVTGHKPSAPGALLVPTHGFVAAAMTVTLLGGGWNGFSGYLNQTPGQPYLPFAGPVLPDNAIWREECGECHLAFHPSLLPARSWRAIMEGQADHFGESLALDPDTAADIETFLLDNAAERHLTEAAWKIDKSLSLSGAPHAVSDTPYWRRKHQELPEGIWEAPKVESRANCGACHLDADAGTFEDAAMKLPEGVESMITHVQSVYE